MSNQLAIKAISDFQLALENSFTTTTQLREYTDHFFAPGIYVRTVFIPAGYGLVGASHKYEVMNILMKGTVVMINELGERVKASAPLIFKGTRGQKAGFAVTDVWYATVHPNPDDLEDIAELEKRMLNLVPTTLEMQS